MDILKFGYRDDVFHVDADLVSEDSLLDIMNRNKQSDVIYSSDPNLPYIIWYIQNRPIVNDEYTLTVLEYWGVYRSYDVIYRDEKYMKDNMYKPEFVNQPMNTNMSYGLTKLDTFSVEYQKFIDSYTKPDGLLFDSLSISPVPSYETVVDRLQGLNYLFNTAKRNDINIVIAGGYIFKILMGVDGSDAVTPFKGDIEDIDDEDHTRRALDKLNLHQPEVDLFFIDSKPLNVSNYINQVAHEVKSLYHGYTKPWLGYDTDTIVSRSTNAISVILEIMGFQVIRINFILKIYRTYSEVLHGFDLDSSCVGWDGVDVWSIERCRFSLYHGYNTVNPDLMSHHYEYRLAKYATMGISVMVPGIENYNIELDDKTRIDDYLSMLAMYGESSLSRHGGLISLLSLEYVYKTGIIMDDMFDIKETTDFGGHVKYRRSGRTYNSLIKFLYRHKHSNRHIRTYTI